MRAHAPRPGRATMVMIDAATRKARPLPEEVVERLEQLRLRDSGE